jgi:DNA-binding NarL/FixJ family response regulator
VLLVDDAAAIRNALRGVLEDVGIQVVGEAPDGVQGVALAGSLRPDVVLMDLRMPSSDGFQAPARIVQEHPEVRVVVLSAYETEESAEAVMAAGAYAFLPSTAAPTASARWSWPPGGPSPCMGSELPHMDQGLCLAISTSTVVPFPGAESMVRGRRPSRPAHACRRGRSGPG